MKLSIPALALALLVLAVGCRTPTEYAFRFSPSPAEVQFQPDAEGPVVARCLVSVLEARREGDRPEGHPSMLVRILVENRGPAPVRLEATDRQLVGSSLETFGDPRVEPVVEDIAPGTNRTYDAWFPYPNDVGLAFPELTGVNLHLGLHYAGGKAEVGMGFERVVLYGDDTRFHGSVHLGYFHY